MKRLFVLIAILAIFVLVLPVVAQALCPSGLPEPCGPGGTPYKVFPSNGEAPGRDCEPGGGLPTPWGPGGTPCPSDVTLMDLLIPRAEAAEPVSVCDVGGGVQLELHKRNDGKWDLSLDSSGCNLLVEGRADTDVQQHDIWVLRSPEGEMDLGPDRVLIVAEGSAWAYPCDWNMEDFSASKPPISAEFVNAKRANMQDNGYDWPIIVHDTAGNTLTFGSGVTVANVVLPDNCAFSEPEQLEVSGVYNLATKAFSASVGAQNCQTIAWLDGQETRWTGARDNVVFLSVEAWMMPSSWSEDQVNAWVGNHK